MILLKISFVFVFIFLHLDYLHANPRSCVCYICEPLLYWNMTRVAGKQHQRVIYVEHDRRDGLGATITHIVYSTSFSFSKNWTWGGLTGRHISHGVDVDYAIREIFRGGLQNLTFSKENFNLSHTVPTVATADTKTMVNISSILASKFPSAPNVLVTWTFMALRRELAVFNAPFIDALRKSTACGVEEIMNQHSLYVNPKSHRVLTIAAHIRLGDALKISNRTTSLSWYREIFSILLDFYPNECQFHVFTSVLLEDYSTEKAVYAEFSKEERIHGNIYYHIDREIHALPGYHKNETEDRNQTMSALIDWSHLSTADVFIMAKSSFSFVPALINPNCIIYHRFLVHEPLDHWTILPEIPSNASELHDLILTKTVPCIASVLLKKKKKKKNNNNHKRF